jgi:hypothetical protein
LKWSALVVAIASCSPTRPAEQAADVSNVVAPPGVMRWAYVEADDSVPARRETYELTITGDRAELTARLFCEREPEPLRLHITGARQGDRLSLDVADGGLHASVTCERKVTPIHPASARLTYGECSTEDQLIWSEPAAAAETWACTPAWSRSDEDRISGRHRGAVWVFGPWPGIELVRYRCWLHDWNKPSFGLHALAPQR